MAEIKTKPTAESVEAFIDKIDNEQKRKDSLVLLDLMKQVSGEAPRMWGSSMVGFGEKRYKSPSTGREVNYFKIGFSPRKANLTIYVVMDIQQHQAALNKLGKHKTGGGCLYINKLSDIHLETLQGIIEAAYQEK